MFCHEEHDEDGHLALFAYKMATQGFSLMASEKRSKAFCTSPARGNHMIKI